LKSITKGITLLIWDLDFHRISTQHIKLAGKDCQGTVILNNYFAMHQIIVAAADNPPGLTSNHNSQKKKKAISVEQHKIAKEFFSKVNE
jgi:hypothetical protein